MRNPHKVMVSFALLLVFSMLLLILFGDNGLADLNILRTERDRLVQENESLAIENLHLYNQIERLRRDPEFIENVARQELGMIGTNEIILKFRKSP